mgnify:CR=1 FL=1
MSFFIIESGFYLWYYTITNYIRKVDRNMKQYIFLLEIPLNPIEVKFEAEGMLDALTQAKEFLKKTMKNHSSEIGIQFKGTIYLN